MYVLDNGSYAFTRADYAPLLAAWKKGEAFYTASDLFGSPVTVKLARVEAVADNSADACAAGIADDEEYKRDQAIKGGD